MAVKYTSPTNITRKILAQTSGRLYERTQLELKEMVLALAVAHTILRSPDLPSSHPLLMLMVW